MCGVNLRAQQLRFALGVYLPVPYTINRAPPCSSFSFKSIEEFLLTAVSCCKRHGFFNLHSQVRISRPLNCTASPTTYISNQPRELAAQSPVPAWNPHPRNPMLQSPIRRNRIRLPHHNLLHDRHARPATPSLRPLATQQAQPARFAPSNRRFDRHDHNLNLHYDTMPESLAIHSHRSMEARPLSHIRLPESSCRGHHPEIHTTGLG